MRFAEYAKLHPHEDLPMRVWQSKPPSSHFSLRSSRPAVAFQERVSSSTSINSGFAAFQLEVGPNGGRGLFDPKKNPNEIIQPEPIEVIRILLFRPKPDSSPNWEAANKKRCFWTSRADLEFPKS